MTRLTLNWFKLCITEVISTFIPLPPPTHNHLTTTTGIRITIIIYSVLSYKRRRDLQWIGWTGDG